MSVLAARSIAALCAAGAFTVAALGQADPLPIPSFDSVVHVAVRFPRANLRPGQAPSQQDWVRVERPSSGFVVDERGYVVTAAHLVHEMLDAEAARRGRYELFVVLQGGLQHSAAIVAHDARRNLALLEVELGKGQKLTAAELCAEAPRAGVLCRALGWPDGEKRHAFHGALGLAAGPLTLRGQRIEASEALLCEGALLDMVDGGALCDLEGRVLGLVNTAHVLAPVQEPKVEDLRKPDYAIALSSSAIRAAFADALAKLPAKSKPRFEQDRAARAVARIAPSVVSVWAGDAAKRPSEPPLDDPYARRREGRLGSGVILNAEGLIATSALAIPTRAETISVRLADGETVPAKVLPVKGARAHGVAFLSIEGATKKKLAPAALASSRTANAGEWIASVARPYAAQPLVASGILSTAPTELRLQIAARLHEGHDGGAIVNADGELLAIATVAPVVPTPGQFVRESGIGFAAALDALRDELGTEVAWPAFAESSEAQRAARRTAVAAVVEATKGSLLNIYVKTAAAKKSEGFDPFGGEGEVEFQTQGLGSGVVIDAGGLAITNWHVVDSATQSGGVQREDAALEVSLPDGRSFGARVLSTSRDDDLALLQLELPQGTALKPVELGDSTALQVGETVVTIGNPFGRANTVACGIVANLNRDADIKGRVRKMRGLIQTDAAVNPGNSGGAMLDARGRLIGINSAGNGWTTGEGFAIPVARMQEVFREKLLSVEGLRSVYLGIHPREDGGKLVIERVELESPAARAGLAKDDVLLELGGTKLAQTGDFARAVLRASAGSELAVRVSRGGKAIDAKLHPISHLAYAFARQTGLELAEVDVRSASELVRDASVALHRAYTGDASGEPQELMHAVLRIERVDPAVAKGDLDVRVGDLLLGVTMQIADAELQRSELVRFETLAAARAFFLRAKKEEVNELACWVFREGQAREVRLRT
ncbi:MAG: trypsin-like peptidase domain-containing protein [Planctomycetes bacterium]|nr:trypsin-like peptidase domain-containing protein [Planctomycetota bacterium]